MRLKTFTIPAVLHAFAMTDDHPLSNGAWSVPSPLLTQPMGIRRAGVPAVLRSFSQGRRELSFALGPRPRAPPGRAILSEDFVCPGPVSGRCNWSMLNNSARSNHEPGSLSRLQTLQAQINPHVLVNSLTRLRAPSNRSNVEARRRVLNLSDSFFR